MQASRFDGTRHSWRRAVANHFRPPQFPGDELKTRRAALLNIGLLGAIVFYAVVLSTALWMPNPSQWLVLVLLLSLGACILLYASLRRGFLKLASVGIVILSITSATLGIALTGEFRPPASAGFLAIVVIAGLLFDRRGIILTVAASSGVVFLLFLAEDAPLFPAPTPENTFQQWLLFTGLLLVVGILGFISGRLVRDALARANQELNERKRAEAVLQESEERYRRLVTSAQDVIYRMSLPDGSYEYVSPAAAQIFGCTPEEFYATPLLVKQVLHPAWRAYFETEWQKLLAGEMAPSYEYEIVTGAGNKRWIFQRNVLVRNAHGAPIALEGIATDITARKRAEQIALARSRLLQESFTRDWRDILQLVLDEAEGLTDSCIGFFHFLESDQTTLVLQNWSTRTKNEFCHAVGAGLHYPVETAGVWADCVRERRPIIYNSYDTLPNRKGMPPGHAIVERFVTIPIFRADAIVGIIGVGNAPTDYTTQDVETVQQLADLTWDIVERKRAQAALEHLSTHDVLTGVCNRAFFETELARLEHSREYPISILVADLDNLKWTNDTYGHAVGDALLRCAAQALGSAFRASDILARIGGDEFAPLLPNTDAESTQHILTRVQANLAAHNATANDVPLSLSIGVATSENGNLLDMLRRADAAMYINKRAHKIARNHEIPA